VVRWVCPARGLRRLRLRKHPRRGICFDSTRCQWQSRRFRRPVGAGLSTVDSALRAPEETANQGRADRPVRGIDFLPAAQAYKRDCQAGVLRDRSAGAQPAGNADNSNSAVPAPHTRISPGQKNEENGG
jgi:hypothetical protein